jgi:hypothetical protein
MRTAYEEHETGMLRLGHVGEEVKPSLEKREQG